MERVNVSTRPKSSNEEEREERESEEEVKVLEQMENFRI